MFSRAVIAMVALTIGTTARLSAQQPWYTLYEEGKKAFEKRDYKVAEQRMLAALNSSQAPRERSRRVLYYSQIRRDFFPEYYLSLICAQQGRYAEAVKYAKTAESYLKSGDNEYGTLVAARSEAEKKLAGNGVTAPKVASNPDDAPGPRATPAPPPTDLPNNPPPTNPPDNSAAAAAADRERVDAQRRADEQSRRARVDTFVKQVQTDIGARQFGAARSNVRAARDLGIDNVRADDLVKSIDVAEALQTARDASNSKQWVEARRSAARALELNPGNSEAKRLVDLAVKSLATNQLERDALRAFYTGDYSTSASLLERLVRDASDPARGYFYLACNNAAMGLLAGPAGEAQLTRAQALYARVRSRQNEFEVDRRYISPKILQALNRPPTRANR